MGALRDPLQQPRPTPPILGDPPKYYPRILTPPQYFRPLPSCCVELLYHSLACLNACFVTEKK